MKCGKKFEGTRWLPFSSDLFSRRASNELRSQIIDKWPSVAFNCSTIQDRLMINFRCKSRESFNAFWFIRAIDKKRSVFLSRTSVQRHSQLTATLIGFTYAKHFYFSCPLRSAVVDSESIRRTVNTPQTVRRHDRLEIKLCVVQ